MSDHIPVSVIRAVHQASVDLGVNEAHIDLISYEPVDWPDSSLGVPREGEFYAQMITPGYRVTLRAGGQLVRYHTDSGDRAVRAG